MASIILSLLQSVQGQELMGTKQRADNLYEQGLYVEAEEAYKEIVAQSRSVEKDTLAKYFWKLIRTQNKLGIPDLDESIIAFLADNESRIILPNLIDKIKIQLAIYYISKGNWQKAKAIEKQIIQSYADEEKDRQSIIDAHRGLTYIYNVQGMLDSSEYHLLKAKKEIEDFLPVNDVEYGYFNYNAALLYTNKGKSEVAIDYFEKALVNLKQNLEKDHPNLGILSYSYAVELSNLGNYEKARSLLFYASDVFQAKGLDYNLSFVYGNLAKLESSVYNYEEYKLYLDKTASILDTIEVFPSYLLANLYSGYAGYYSDYEYDYQKAKSYGLLALNHTKALETEPSLDLSRAYYKTGLFLMTNDSMELGASYIDSAAMIYDKLDIDEGLYYYHLIGDQGRLALDRGNVEVGIQLLKKSLKGYSKYFSDSYSLVAQQVNSIIEGYELLGNTDSVLHYIDLGLSTIKSNGTYSGLINSEVTKIFSKKLTYFLRSKLPIDQVEALYNEIEDFIKASRINLNFETDYNDVIELEQSRTLLINQAIQFAVNNKTAYQDLKLEEYIYSFRMELEDQVLQSKRSARARLQLMGATPEQIVEYNNLMLEAKNLELASISEDYDDIVEFSNRKIEFKRVSFDFLQSLQQNFKESIDNEYTYKDFNHVINDQNTQAICYSILDSNYTALTFDSEEIEYTVLSNVEEVNLRINELRSALLNSDQAEAIKSALKLYELLLKPLINKKSKRLFIVPYGTLNVLPFDMLISQIAPSNDWNEQAWVLKDYIISYGSSIRLQDQMGEDYKEKLIIAPGFEDNKSSSSKVKSKLNRTPWTTQFAIKLKDRIGATLLQDSSANLSNWNRLKHNKGLIHFGTHALVDKLSPIKSKLVLSADGEGITLQDLYQSKLNSTLIVLAGCETGLGLNQGNRATVSIAQAFRYAGCHQLIQSLWKIDDEKTNQILDEFYKSFSLQRDQVNALHDAKLKYIKSTSGGFASPYYWAGIQHYGTLMAPSRSSYWLWGLCLTFVGLAIFWYLSKRT